MHRFYMNPETRQALIAESQRLIAARAAAASSQHVSLAPALIRKEAATEDHAGATSAFAALVSELTSDSSTWRTPQREREAAR